jgi:transglutaminase-like putative cysteine protease
MTSRQFWNQRRQRRSSKRSVLLLAAGLFFGAPVADGVNVPDWLERAVRETVPPQEKDTVAVVLYTEQQTIVRDNGAIETRYREAIKILRREGKDYGTVVVEFTKDTPLTYFKAWSVPAEGKPYEVKDKDSVEVGVEGGDLYDDVRKKVLEIPAADPGNVVGYEYVQKGRPNVFQDGWWFQELIPVLRGQYTLRIPTGWKFDYHWANYKELPPQSTEANQYIWQLSDVPAVTLEDEMPPWRAVAGRLDVKYYSPQNTSQAEQSGSWRDLGVWYSRLTASSRQVTPEIQQEVLNLTTHATTPLDKIEALTSYLQRQVRYVAIEIGIGGYQPHPASEVFKNQFGDCKDKVTLLSTMLQAIGIESFYALAQIDRGIVQPDFPSVISFNHMILAIRLPEGVPDTKLYAIVNDPKYGKLLFFDPTDPYTPLGYLPDSEQDNYVLLFNPDGGELVHLPLLPASTNRLLRTAQFKLDSLGNISGQVKEIRWGSLAMYSRAQYLIVAPKDRSKIVDQFLGTFLDNFQLQSATVGNLTEYDQNLTLDYSFVAPNYAKMAGDMIILRPRVLGEKGRAILAGKERKYPVQYPDATMQTDEFDFTLPAGYAVEDLPAPVKVDSEFVGYQSEVKVDGGVLRYKRSYQIKNVIVPTLKLPELKTALGEIASDERSSIILKRSAN